MKNNITVVHHSADMDGIFCREIARKFLPDAELIGWDFADAPLQVPKEGMVYVLDLPADRPFGFDFSKEPPPEATIWNRLIWIDHHASSIASHPKDIPGYRIDGVAACRLAWQWFTVVDGNTNHGNVGNPVRAAGVLPMIQDFKAREVKEPLAVRLVGEYDIWDKRDARAELFQHGLRSEELAGGVLGELLSGDDELAEQAVDRLLRQGLVLQYAKAKENESIIKELGFTIHWEGLTFLACNAARYNSLLFTAGLKPEHDACFGFKWTGKTWSISLYHAPGKEHHDLSVIAMRYGGGGHKGACGFQSATLPFGLHNIPPTK